MNGWHTTYDPASPWESIWHALVNTEREWWYEQIEKHCNRVACGAGRLSNYVDGGQPTSGSQPTNYIRENLNYPVQQPAKKQTTASKAAGAEKGTGLGW